MTEQQVNGTTPAAEQAEAVPASERIMGLFGMAFAAAVFAIGLDLLTGGKVLVFLGSAVGAGGQADNSGQPGA